VGGKVFPAGDRAIGNRASDSLLDFPLRVDANNLQKFADAEVKGLLVHSGNSLIAAAARRRE